jgi:hypothetical protein
MNIPHQQLILLLPHIRLLKTLKMYYILGNISGSKHYLLHSHSHQKMGKKYPFFRIYFLVLMQLVIIPYFKKLKKGVQKLGNLTGKLLTVWFKEVKLVEGTT